MKKIKNFKHMVFIITGLLLLSSLLSAGQFQFNVSSKNQEEILDFIEYNPDIIESYDFYSTSCSDCGINDQPNLNGYLENNFGESDCEEYHGGMDPRYLPPLDDWGFPPLVTKSLPSEFDWRDFEGGDWTTPVQNQNPYCDYCSSYCERYCGACWAFAAMGALESQINIAWDNPDLDIDLSEQYILSCIPRSGTCGGGWSNYAFQYIMSETADGNFVNGIIPESCFPYQAMCTVPCSQKSPDWKEHLIPIKDYGYYDPTNIYEIQQQLIDGGPVIASMYVTTDFKEWGCTHHDPEDVYYTSQNYEYTNHGVVIVGYNNTDEYWICKNSWGTEWGNGGFFKIAYGCLNIDRYYVVWVEYEPSPLASFTIIPDNPLSGENVDFTDTSTDIGADITSWSWNFGDGTTSALQHPTHQYNNEGVYTITLTLTDEQGYTDTVSQTIRVGAPNTLYVGGSGPNNYYAIQLAINDAIMGDTIYVHSGRYLGKIEIDKPIQLIGEEKTSTIIDGLWRESVVIITSDHVTVTGFTIENSRNSYYFSGIQIHSNENRITDNLIKDNKQGINILGGYNTIQDNIIIENFGNGILLPDSSNYNTIYNNVITNNNNGILLNSWCNNNVIEKNTITQNTDKGIDMKLTRINFFIDNNFIENIYGIRSTVDYPYWEYNIGNIYTGNYFEQNTIGISLTNPLYETINRNIFRRNMQNGIHFYGGIIYNNKIHALTISENLIEENGFGIRSQGSTNSVVEGNIIKNNNHGGIYIKWWNKNTISQNLIENNENYSGINLRVSSENIIVENTIKNNEPYGIHLWQSSINNQLFHNNLISNLEQAKDECQDNTWDNGYPDGGNYWNNHLVGDHFSGINQYQPGSDGIRDKPYIFNGNQDQYPLTINYPAADLTITTLSTQYIHEIIMKITATVKNIGIKDVSKPFNIGFYGVQTQQDPEQQQNNIFMIDNPMVSSLTIGETVEVSIHWEIDPKIQIYAIYAIADNTNVVLESIETNNQAIIVLN